MKSFRSYLNIANIWEFGNKRDTKICMQMSSAEINSKKWKTSIGSSENFTWIEFALCILFFYVSNLAFSLLFPTTRLIWRQILYLHAVHSKRRNAAKGTFNISMNRKQSLLNKGFRSCRFFVLVHILIYVFVSIFIIISVFHVFLYL